MKISETRPVSEVAAVRGRAAKTGEGTKAASSPRAIADSASVMGIPENELTPKVREAIMTLMAEVDHLRRELEGTKSRLAQVERLADEDPLYPILNRRAFVRDLSRVLSYSERYDTPASLLYFDVNDFKRINDTYGHPAGDEALKHVARTFVENVRDSDSVGRLGGDEFGIILAHADRAAALEKAQSLAEIIRTTPFGWQGKEVSLNVAYGVYTFRPGEDAGAALAAADKAMYANKGAAIAED